MKLIFVIPDMSWLYDYKAQFSLGILYLSSVLKEMGCEVGIFDSNAAPIGEIPDADVYAFSVVYNTYQSSVSLAKEIRNKYPDRKLIIGGVHATLDPENIDPVFDSIFTGEAESTIREFVEDQRAGRHKKMYKQNREINIDDLYPDRSLLPIDYIRTSSLFTGGVEYDTKGKGSTALMFSRGCPYKCAFCSSPQLYGPKIRFRPVSSIVKEIKDIIETYNIRQFRIQDDTFTFNKKYVTELTDELKKLDIFYRCSTRVNTVTDDIIQRLYDSGCREIGVGIEVANDTVLDRLNKRITVAQAEAAIDVIRKYPITVRCFFMIGLPFDSYETVQDNIDFIERNRVDNVVVGNFIPFPGNDMHTNMEKYNIRSVKENTCMNIAKHLELRPNILRTDISEEEHIKIMKKFYNYLEEKKFV